MEIEPYLNPTSLESCPKQIFSNNSKKYDHYKKI